MAGRIQIEFTRFPGIEPMAVADAYKVDGWNHLLAPWRKGNAEDEEAISDAAMELVDWAIDDHPAVFGFDHATGEYEEANDLSIALAGAIVDATDGGTRTPGRGGCWSEWYTDVDLIPDAVTVRVAFFA